MSTLDLGLVGNCSIGALIDAKAEVTWACFPRFDGDAVFCSLLRGRGGERDFGYFAVDVVDTARTEQAYIDHTAVLVTRIHDRQGGVVEVTDFAPRFRQHGRSFCPMLLTRRVRCVGGSPRIVLRVRPACTLEERELTALGRHEEARALFERLLACRNRLGLLAEHIDPRTGEQWGNFVQTYSMVGLINSAIRLSIPWDRAF
jgi:GH15 family glucan-1,4-alpha-glucosidase